MNSTPVKICFIAPKAYPIFNPQIKSVFGGAEVDLYLLATELAKDPKFKVNFIVADYGQPACESINNVTIIKSLNFNESQISGAKKLWSALKQAKSDIYFTEAAHHGHALIALYCKLAKSKYIFRSANPSNLNGDWINNNGLRGRLFKWSLKQCHTIIAQNQSDKDALRNNLELPSTVIANCCCLKETCGEDKKNILWVGRSDSVKQPELFLDIAKCIPDRQFVMICPRATNDSRYNLLTSQAKSIDNLKFIEHVPFHQIGSYFEDARLLVNTSSTEGFPNVFVQACQVATPIISLNVNPDGFLDKYQCGKCANGSLEDCICIIQNLLQSDEYALYSQNAFNYACDNHDIKKIINQYKQLFNSVVK